jgi:hypothetical protein
MEFLSEDPTYLLSGLGVVAVASLIALRVTQKGKFLIVAGAALALALVVFVVERAWVTQAERIAMVVEDLRRAVEASDVEGVTRHLTPDVQFVQGDRTVGSSLTLAFIRSTLEHAGLDFVRVSGLSTAAFPQSRRGTAEFRVMAKGSLKTQVGATPIGSAGSEWSLGFQETSPDVWKVNRITPISVPRGMMTP